MGALLSGRDGHGANPVESLTVGVAGVDSPSKLVIHPPNPAQTQSDANGTYPV
jgi:hypothetical protein